MSLAYHRALGPSSVGRGFYVANSDLDLNLTKIRVKFRTNFLQFSPKNMSVNFGLTLGKIITLTPGLKPSRPPESHPPIQTRSGNFPSSLGSACGPGQHDWHCTAADPARLPAALAPARAQRPLDQLVQPLPASAEPRLRLPPPNPPAQTYPQPPCTSAGTIHKTLGDSRRLWVGLGWVSGWVDTSPAGEKVRFRKVRAGKSAPPLGGQSVNLWPRHSPRSQGECRYLSAGPLQSARGAAAVAGRRPASAARPLPGGDRPLPRAAVPPPQGPPRHPRPALCPRVSSVLARRRGQRRGFGPLVRVELWPFQSPSPLCVSVEVLRVGWYGDLLSSSASTYGEDEWCGESTLAGRNILHFMVSHPGELSCLRYYQGSLWWCFPDNTHAFWCDKVCRVFFSFASDAFQDFKASGGNL